MRKIPQHSDFFCANQYLASCLNPIVVWLCALLLSAVSTMAFARISGPANSSTGRYTLNLIAPSETDRLRFSGQRLKVYYNGSLKQQVNLSLFARSYTAVVDQEGQWRYEHWVTMEQCIIFMGNQCLEWDQAEGSAGSHTVTVSFEHSPPPDAPVPNAISGPANTTTGKATLTFSPPIQDERLRVAGQRIRAFRNNQAVTTYSLSATATSLTVTLDQDGTWRFDHYVQLDYCSIWVREQCLEWDQIESKKGDHTLEAHRLCCVRDYVAARF